MYSCIGFVFDVDISAISKLDCRCCFDLAIFEGVAGFFRNESTVVSRTCCAKSIVAFVRISRTRLVTLSLVLNLSVSRSLAVNMSGIVVDEAALFVRKCCCFCVKVL